MAHMMKFTRSSCGHMFAHFDRSANNISNENLDSSRTHLNYNLAQRQNREQIDFLRKRCNEIKCQNRKDVNVMVSWVVTAPKDLDEKEHDAFFKASYDFLKERYGEINVISCYVHKDEVTPHMHFSFVPVKYAFKPCREDKEMSVGYFKVSAKEVVNRYDLKTFHQDLQNHVEKVLGHEVNILNEATKNGNKSIEELKRQSATERLEEANKKAYQVVLKAEMQADGIKEDVISANAEYEAKKAYVREADKLSQVSMMYPSEAKISEKGVLHKKKFVTVPAELWEAKHVSANEKSYLRRANEELEKSIEEFKDSASSKNIERLMQRVDDLKEKNSKLSMENHKLRYQLDAVKVKENKTLKMVNKVLERLPDESADIFVKTWKSIEQNMENMRDLGHDMER